MIDKNAYADGLRGRASTRSREEQIYGYENIWTAHPDRRGGYVGMYAALRLQKKLRPDEATVTAAVPDLSKDEPVATCAPSAQHAVRQAKRLADNVVAVMRGGKPKAYMHADVGSVASLGLYKGVAEVYGVRLRGFPAWFMHRGYHLGRVPTLGHKTRVAADWALALLFGREVVSLGQVEQPRWEWEAVTLAQVSGPRPVQAAHEGVGEQGLRRQG